MMMTMNSISKQLIGVMSPQPSLLVDTDSGECGDYEVGDV